MEPIEDDEVLAGRRLPYSRPFAQAGFERDESEAWRRAGWSDPVEAARWRHLGHRCPPSQLHILASERFTIEDVERAARELPSFTAACVRAAARASGASTPPDVEIDLRDRVRENLFRDQPGLLGTLRSERSTVV